MSEVSTELSGKDIFIITSSWDQGPQELARVLNVGDGAVSDCDIMLQNWAEQSQGDKRGKLAKLFDKEGYPNMSGVILRLPFQD